MEKMISEKKIRNYGLATWVCFRSKPEETGLYLNLEKVVKAAETVGGKNHGLKFIQVSRFLINYIIHSLNFFLNQFFYFARLNLGKIFKVLENN